MNRLFALLLLIPGALMTQVFADQNESIRIAVPVDNAPYSSALPGAEAEGYDVDVAVAALNASGRKVILTATSRSHALELLSSGKVDAITGWPVSSTANAGSNLFISSTYRHSTLGAWVRKNALFRNTGDLGHARNAAVGDSSAWEFARQRGWEPQAMDSWEEAFNALDSGEVDAVIAPQATGREMLSSMNASGIRQLSGELSSLPVAFMARDRETLALLDQKLNMLNLTGNLGRLEENWGTTETTTPAIRHEPFLAFGYGAMIIMAAILLIRRTQPGVRSRGLSSIAPRPVMLPRAPLH